MLTLLTNNPSSAEPVLPLRWCVTPDILAKLKAKDVTHPQLLISVWHPGREREVFRRCVPLEQAIEYLEFNHAGLNTVNTAIVWGDSRQFLSEANRVYESLRPYDWEGKFMPMELESVRGCIGEALATLEVNVPAEFFAHEPPEWEQGWVNFWFENPPRDQCGYRKRRFVAYTIQPIAVLLWVIFITLVRTVYALLTAIAGVRGLKLEPIFHPFRDETKEVWYNPGPYGRDGIENWLSPQNNFFSVDALGNRRSFGFALLHPLIWVAIGSGLAFIYTLSLSMMATLLTILKYASLIALAGIVVGLIFAGIGKLANRFNWNPFAKIGAKLDEAERFAMETRERLRVTEFETTFAEVTCGVASMSTDIRTLKKPPIHLRFQALKAKVCRPYPRW